MNRHNKDFGLLVRKLRLEREFHGEKWTQEKLAQETGGKLDARQIGRIERGEVVLEREIHVAPLCGAFHLTEMQKSEFYAAAGFVYRPQKRADPRGWIRWLLQQHSYPSLVYTPLSDIVAFNAYYCAMYGHTPAHIAAMREGPLGPNTLRIFLDDFFQRKVYRGGLEGWREAVKRMMYIFRILSLRYITTARYRHIITELKRLYGPDFEYFWRLSEIEPDLSITTVIDPTIRIYHPEFGAMSFMALRIPQDFLGQDIYCTVFLPLTSDEAGYQRLREAVTDPRIHFFDLPAP